MGTSFAPFVAQTNPGRIKETNPVKEILDSLTDEQLDRLKVKKNDLGSMNALYNSKHVDLNSSLLEILKDSTIYEYPTIQLASKEWLCTEFIYIICINTRALVLQSLGDGWEQTKCLEF